MPKPFIAKRNIPGYRQDFSRENGNGRNSCETDIQTILSLDSSNGRNFDSVNSRYTSASRGTSTASSKKRSFVVGKCRRENGERFDGSGIDAGGAGSALSGKIQGMGRHLSVKIKRIRASFRAIKLSEVNMFSIINNSFDGSNMSYRTTCTMTSSGNPSVITRKNLDRLSPNNISPEGLRRKSPPIRYTPDQS